MLLPFALGLLSTVSAVKTSIFVDQIAAYSKLPGCAQNQLSAIVRAQASGCGDDMQLTSFSCFCIEQSTMMASVISIAVQGSCAAEATATAQVTGPLPQVTQALDVFNSYCARSTELPMYQNSATTNVITPAPSSTTSIVKATSAPESKSNSGSSVSIAAIVVPVVIGVIVIAAIVGFFAWYRRRNAQNATAAANNNANPYNANPYNAPVYTPGAASNYENYGPGRDYPDEKGSANGTKAGVMMYRHELENREVMDPVELDGGYMNSDAKEMAIEKPRPAF